MTDRRSGRARGDNQIRFKHPSGLKSAYISDHFSLSVLFTVILLQDLKMGPLASPLCNIVEERNGGGVGCVRTELRYVTDEYFNGSSVLWEELEPRRWMKETRSQDWKWVQRDPSCGHVTLVRMWPANIRCLVFFSLLYVIMNNCFSKINGIALFFLIAKSFVITLREVASFPQQELLAFLWGVWKT